MKPPVIKTLSTLRAFAALKGFTVRKNPDEIEYYPNGLRGTLSGFESTVQDAADSIHSESLRKASSKKLFTSK
tara:strand:+ start:1643 stop:1861 length:219 start_codon:yes stop_codon:yes gene_type:complete